MSTQPKISLRSDQVDIENAFDDDALRDRQKLAERLTKYVDKLQAGAVLGISAPWGEGKTWFGKNWAKSLSSNHRVAFIDAFENDYVADPFLLIASELSVLLDDGENTPLKKNAVAVMKALVPVGTKTIINLAGKLLTGSSDILEDYEESVKAATESAAKASEKWLEKRFESLAAERKSLAGFKDALRSAVGASKTPVVVFVDELDRCKPSFAVTLIERLKHLFDVPNLVFVLLLNRNQLEKSIEGHYGVGTDGQAYLSKFVNLWFDLPGAFQSSSSNETRYKNYFNFALNRYAISATDSSSRVNTKVEDFVAHAAIWATAWKFTLRDVDRFTAIFVLADNPTNAMAAYLIALKVKKPTTFDLLKQEDAETHIACAKGLLALASAKKEAQHWNHNVYQCFAELHTLMSGGEVPKENSKLAKFGAEFLGNYHDPKRAFFGTIDRIDLPVSGY